MVGPVPPLIPNRHDNDEQRLRRLEQQEFDSRRRAIRFLIIGAALIVATVVFALLGWSGVGLMLVPIGLGLMIAGGIGLVTGSDD